MPAKKATTKKAAPKEAPTPIPIPKKVYDELVHSGFTPKEIYNIAIEVKAIATKFL